MEDNSSGPAILYIKGIADSKIASFFQTCYDIEKTRTRSVIAMNIVLLESLGVSEELLHECAKPFLDAGHTFTAYEKNTDPAVQIERAKDADVIMIANMPLSGEVIRACNHLKYIDVAFT